MRLIGFVSILRTN